MADGKNSLTAAVADKGRGTEKTLTARGAKELPRRSQRRKQNVIY
jgi:hypothetical protein